MERPLAFEVRIGPEEIERIARRAAELAAQAMRPAAQPELMTVPEAAEHLRCKRQRVDDLLSQRRLTRIKDGSRTLVARAELEAYLRGEATGRFRSASSSPRPSEAAARTSSANAGSGRSSGTGWT